jgi:antitoxin component YwqK of YwqJK toxin-antitoxin module
MSKRSRNIFFVLLIGLNLVSCADENVTDKEVVESKECNCNDVFLDPEYNHFYTTDRTKPYSGPCKSYYKNGQVSVEKIYVNGRLDGKYFEYYESGTIKSEWNFLNGRQHGDIKGFSEEGYLLYHTVFYKGEQDSTGLKN